MKIERGAKQLERNRIVTLRGEFLTPGSTVHSGTGLSLMAAKESGRHSYRKSLLFIYIGYKSTGCVDGGAR